jgi:hypothetical protein
MLHKKILHKVLTGILLLLLTTVFPAHAAEFLLFYANDVHGETAPCG